MSWIAGIAPCTSRIVSFNLHNRPIVSYFKQQRANVSCHRAFCTMNTALIQVSSSSHLCLVPLASQQVPSTAHQCQKAKPGRILVTFLTLHIVIDNSKSTGFVPLELHSLQYLSNTLFLYKFMRLATDEESLNNLIKVKETASGTAGTKS